MDKDEVSVHTLAAAAYQIIHDLKEHRGEKRDLLYDSVLVKPEYRNKWINAVKRWGNFFKHANNDPEGTIEFSPFGNLMFIMFAMSGLRFLGEKTSYSMNALTAWLVINEPVLITAEFRKHFADHIPIEDIEGFRLIPKAEFYASYIRLSTGPH